MKVSVRRIRSPVTRGITIPPRSTQDEALRGGTYKYFADWFTDCPVGYVRLADCPEIQTPVNITASLVSSMTIHLMENTELGDVRVKNELANMVDITPNKYANHKEFYYSIVKNMLLDGDGNAIVYPVHDSDGLLTDLIPFDMSAVSIIDDPVSYGYYVMYKGKRYDPDEILHFRANPDSARPWIGTGYRVLLRDVANNLTQAQKTKKHFMESPKPSVIVRVDALTEEFSNSEGRKHLQEQYVGDTEDGRPWMVPADLLEVQEIKPLTLKDIALNESVTIDKQTAASIFGVPAYFVGAGDFNRDEYNAFINITIHSLAKIIQQEMSRKLIFGRDWYFKFNHRSLLAYSYEELVNGGGEIVDRMAMSRNEYRDSIGLSPEERYEELLGLENYLPAELLGTQKKLNGVSGEIQETIDVDGVAAQISGIAEVSLNGAQIKSLLAIVQAVAKGEFEKQSAIILITSAFPFSEEIAEKIIGNAGQSFTLNKDEGVQQNE